MGTENKLVVARGWGDRGLGTDCFMSIGFSFDESIFN